MQEGLRRRRAGSVALVLRQAPLGGVRGLAAKATRRRALKEAAIDQSGEALARCILVDVGQVAELAHAAGQEAVIGAIVHTGDFDIDGAVLSAQGAPSGRLHQVLVQLSESTASN